MRFRHLAAELVRANQAMEAGDDKIAVILKCVVSVAHFLDADPIIRCTGITRPFGLLAASLRDLDHGARPRLFFDRPKRGPGRPKDVSFEAARGAIAAAVSALIEWGEPRGVAGQFVADEARKARLTTPKGERISAKHVLRWRDEMGGSASALAESTYKDICAKYRKVPTALVEDQRARRNVVLGALQGVWAGGF